MGHDAGERSALLDEALDLAERLAAAAEEGASRPRRPRSTGSAAARLDGTLERERAVVLSRMIPCDAAPRAARENKRRQGRRGPNTKVVLGRPRTRIATLAPPAHDGRHCMKGHSTARSSRGTSTRSRVSSSARRCSSTARAAWSSRSRRTRRTILQVTRTVWPHGAQRGDVRAARARVRVPLLRHPPLPEPRLRPDVRRRRCSSVRSSPRTGSRSAARGAVRGDEAAVQRAGAPVRIARRDPRSRRARARRAAVSTPAPRGRAGHSGDDAGRDHPRCRPPVALRRPRLALPFPAPPWLPKVAGS